MLMRFDPFHEWEALSEQLRDGRRARLMALDAYRAGDLLHVDLDLPGVKPESIEVTVEKNVLTVKAGAHLEDRGPGDDSLRAPGWYVHQATLPR